MKKLYKESLSWPLNLMYEIFGYKGHICINEDSTLDIDDIPEVERRLLNALNELTTWERDILIRVYRNNETLTSVSKSYNASIDRLNAEMKSATRRIAKTKTRSNDVLLYDDKNHSDRNTTVTRKDNTKNTEVTVWTLISDLPLTTRSNNILVRRNIKTIGDLIKYTEKDLSGFTNMGKISLSEITDLVKRYGFEFATN